MTEGMSSGGTMPKGPAEREAVCPSLQLPAEQGKPCWWVSGPQGTGRAVAPIPCSLCPSPRAP